ncbi:1,4-alpha-glucan-branching protein [Mycobacteroides abscessus subsp. abscessus]|nr:1,4-alpha-glucan-branching protein [Mycobacteroides abscessus subsp. abscessus]
MGTLEQAREQGYVGESFDLPASSWGSGKDWHVWNGEKVADLVQLNTEVVDTALTAVDKAQGFRGRLRALPRAPARTRHPRDSRSPGQRTPRRGISIGGGLESRGRIVRRA